jgi:truncated hemoglobin YjbI
VIRVSELRRRAIDMTVEQGGDAACWLHQFAIDRDDIRTRDDIRRLVVAFCREAARDDELGPVLSAAGTDMDALQDQLSGFWAKELFGQPAPEADPFDERHTARWLAVFESTVDEHFAGRPPSWPRGGPAA